VGLNSYSKILVAFSGGKDSLACVLNLFDLGVPREKIELWHHDIDGNTGDYFMDWPCTPGYCRAVAAELGLPIYYSWRDGGFLREMLRDNQPTAPVTFECPEGCMGHAGGKGPCNTRRRFPQVSADLSVRWCSSSLKIEVAAAGLRNQDRFNHTRTLVVTGERAEESPSRARYKEFETDRSSATKGKLGRHVDHWRPVHGWNETRIWDIIAKYRMRPHPCYELGWGRCSCASCIFGSKDQWASLALIAPEHVERICRYEEEFGCTIQRKKSVRQLVKEGAPYPVLLTKEVEDSRRQSLDPVYHLSLRPDIWRLPAGAFGESIGPT